MSGGTHKLDRRAQGVSSFFIQDNSPLLTYSDNDWTTGYAPQPSGYDQTLHMTSSSGSRVSFNLAATSLTLLVPAFENCTSVISINGSDPITACSTRVGDSNDVPFSLYSLPLGVHSVIWDVGNVPADTDIIFWGVDGTRQAEPDGFSNVTIDNTFQQSTDGAVKLAYAGNWQSIGGGSGAETDLSEKDSLDGYFNKTLSVTKERGSSVAFTGKGSAVYLYGNVGPDYGAMTIAVNDQVVESSLNLTSPWPMPYELLWYRTGLDPNNPTEVIMTSLADSKMALDFVLFTTGPDTISALTATVEEPKEGFASTLAGKVVLMFLIPVVALTLLAFLLFMLFRRRRSRHAAKLAEQHHRQHSHSSSAEFKFPHGSDGEGRWSAEPKSSRYSTHSEPSEADLVFVSYDEGKGQRMSEHWNKQSFSTSAAGTSTSETAWNHEEQQEVMTPRSALSGASRSPPMELRSLPQSVRGSSIRGFSVTDERSAASGSEQYHGEDEQSETQSTWGRPFEAMTGGRFPVSVAGSRRGTLPAYSADGDTIPPVPTPPGSASAVGTENASMFSPADTEKRVLQAAYSVYNTPTSPLGEGVPSVASSCAANDNDDNDDSGADAERTPGPSHKRLTHQTHTSAAPSIISVFGSPPSERRRSVARTPAPRNSIPRPPSKIDMSFLKRKPPPDMPLPSPTSSRVPFPSSPESTRVHPKSSMPAGQAIEHERGDRPSLPLPTSFQEVSSDKETTGDGIAQGHVRNRSLGGISARTDFSAARPDSVIIPFEDFVQSLVSSPAGTPADQDVFGGPSFQRSTEGRSSPLVPKP